MWQDAVLGAMSLAMNLAFIPTILGKDKPNRWTAGMFVMALLIGGTTMLTLGLWLAAVTQLLGAVEWGITIFQKRQAPSNDVSVAEVLDSAAFTIAEVNDCEPCATTLIHLAEDVRKK